MQEDKYTRNWQKARSRALEKGLRVVEIGWEQHVIIDEHGGVVYRYPRHEAAAAKLADEVAVLHDVNALDWPVALPVMREHNDEYTSYVYIPGEVLTPARVAGLTEDEFDKIGRRLGDFLARFHRLDFAIVDQKKTRHSGTLLEYYDGRITSSTDTRFYEGAQAALSKLKDMSGSATPVVIHGDIHGPNVVVNPATNEVCGVIDLSEMETGDPHIEFRKIFMTFRGSLEAALESYERGGGQKLDPEAIRQWAYVNEWANVSFFADVPDNPTYQRALTHLTKWGQL